MASDSYRGEVAARGSGGAGTQNRDLKIGEPAQGVSCAAGRRRLLESRQQCCGCSAGVKKTRQSSSIPPFRAAAMRSSADRAHTAHTALTALTPRSHASSRVARPPCVASSRASALAWPRSCCTSASRATCGAATEGGMWGVKGPQAALLWSRQIQARGARRPRGPLAGGAAQQPTLGAGRRRMAGGSCRAPAPPPPAQQRRNRGGSW
jgi:hypothetical protein